MAQDEGSEEWLGQRAGTLVSELDIYWVFCTATLKLDDPEVTFIRIWELPAGWKL